MCKETKVDCNHLIEGEFCHIEECRCSMLSGFTCRHSNNEKRRRAAVSDVRIILVDMKTNKAVNRMMTVGEFEEMKYNFTEDWKDMIK